MVFDISSDTELTEQILAMLVEQFSSDKNSIRIMESQLLVFFSLLTRKYEKNLLTHEQVDIKQQHWEIIEYIKENFRTLTHAKLAAKFNLSIVHCSRVIKSMTGKSYTALVQELRMDQARVMLSQSDTKIYDISFSLGYEDQGTFIRNFKKANGVTPTQYRKENSG